MGLEFEICFLRIVCDLGFEIWNLYDGIFPLCQDSCHLLAAWIAVVINGHPAGCVPEIPKTL